ncbi:MAG: adenosylmethionine--8-amino-7-oxononanoate transaminase [Puniceicoccales bacterium]|jgi:adenosylmethionine-8-amino-7-oxononanoate aminotransferase|nr:adenosylmethionine--8-amino-7-oxononanoate transaminase [Puniceicoccales bacterium]
MESENSTAIFVTGTDTNVGKTQVTAALLRRWLISASQADGCIAAIKPIQTGCDTADASDITVYRLAISDLPANRQQCVDVACLREFKAACSPHLAAEWEKNQIAPGPLLEELLAIIRSHASTLIEGAGGILAPINDQEFSMADLAAALNIPIVLVAHNRVGALNQVFLAMAELVRRSLPVAAIVLNQIMEITSLEEERYCEDNVIRIKNRFPLVPIITIPFCSGMPNVRLNTMERHLGKQLPAKFFISQLKVSTSEEPSACQTFDREHLWHPYEDSSPSSPPLPVVSARGVYLHLADGRVLIDGISSWWCVIHGYNHPRLNGAIGKQLQSMAHIMFAGLTHEPAVELGQRLLALAPGNLQKIFYADSGSIAVEVAIKMAVQWSRGIGKPERQRFFALSGAYHGDTFGAMSLCDPEGGMHRRFSAILPQQIFLPRPRIPFGQAIDGAVERQRYEPFFKKYAHEVAGFFLEPIAQCAGGFWFYSADYLELFKRLCEEYDILFIADEIATGFGRTGKLFACEWANIAPDILCVGKGLTGGCITLAATLTTDAIARAIARDGPLMHGPTYMANPLACAAASASLYLIADGTWRKKTWHIEKFLRENLAPLSNFEGIADVRVLGSMGVVEVREPVNRQSFQRYCVDRGVWLRPFANVLYTMPAYIIDDDQLQKITSAIGGWFSSPEKEISAKPCV